MFQDAGQGQEYSPEQGPIITPTSFSGYENEKHDELGMKYTCQNLGLLIAEPKFRRDIEQKIVNQVWSCEEYEDQPYYDDEIAPLIFLIQSKTSNSCKAHLT